MTVTSPEVTPREADTDDEGVHIRCMDCRVEPMRAVCGADLVGEDEVAGVVPIRCPRCKELWPTHVAVLHSGL